MAETVTIGNDLYGGTIVVRTRPPRRERLDRDRIPTINHGPYAKVTWRTGMGREKNRPVWSSVRGEWDGSWIARVSEEGRTLIKRLMDRYDWCPERMLQTSAKNGMGRAWVARAMESLGHDETRAVATDAVVVAVTKFMPLMGVAFDTYVWFPVLAAVQKAVRKAQKHAHVGRMTSADGDPIDVPDRRSARAMDRLYQRDALKVAFTLFTRRQRRVMTAWMAAVEAGGSVSVPNLARKMRVSRERVMEMMEDGKLLMRGVVG